jgi:hypothetical protein
VIKVIVHWAWLPVIIWFGTTAAGSKYNMITVMFPFFETPESSQPQKTQQEEQMGVGVDDEGNVYFLFHTSFLLSLLSFCLSLSLSLYQFLIDS